jgi:hypothetical protein
MRSGKAIFASILAIAIVLMLTPAPVEAGDRSFSSMVNHLKSNYKARQQGFWGALTLARILVRIVKPAGVKNFKVVVLRDLDFSRAPAAADFHRASSHLIGKDWQPLVKYNSHRNNQYTHVYVQQLPEDVKLFVVSVQRTEAVLVQVKFSPEKLARFMDDPKIMGISLKEKTSDPPPQGGQDQAKASKDASLYW